MKSVSDIISYEIKFHILDKLYNQVIKNVHMKQVPDRISYRVYNVRKLGNEKVYDRVSQKVYRGVGSIVHEQIRLQVFSQLYAEIIVEIIKKTESYEFSKR